MFIIRNKLRILSAVILAITTSATVLSACVGNEMPEIPAETVVGTHGEILGVSVVTKENSSETQTVLYEITTKKPKKTKAAKTSKHDTDGKTNKSDDSASSNNSSPKISVRNNSSEATLKSTKARESTSRVRPTFPPKTVQKTSRVAATFESKETTKHTPVSYVAKTEKYKTTKKVVVSTIKHSTAQTRPDSNTPVYDEKVSEKSSGINVVFKTDSVEKGTTASVMIQGEPGKKYSIDFYISPTETADYSDLADQTADENGFVTWTFNIPSNCSAGSKKIIIKEKGSDNFAQTSINII